ncbi:MAG: hypothetical protein ACE5IB_08000 [Candidatus Geothermarchaeales archaeon]
MATCDSWRKAHERYRWTVNLSRFKESERYEGYFDRTITARDVTLFEDEFRDAVESGASYVLAGEVCYWRNHSNPNPHNLTRNLLNHLKSESNWAKFRHSLGTLATNPTYHHFEGIIEACRQTGGFGTPLTFLAFYEPERYPMVDKHIVDWWAEHRKEFGYGDEPKFSQRRDGSIQPHTREQRKQNWRAYLAWARFCVEYSQKLGESCGLHWRARDVEMAVWMAQKGGMSLAPQAKRE